MPVKLTRPRRASIGRAQQQRWTGKSEGLSPFPGAWFDLDGTQVKVLASKLAEGEGAAGEVLDDTLRVGCGEGAVQLIRLQRAGKAAQDAQTFQRGAQIAAGTVLSKG